PTATPGWSWSSRSIADSPSYGESPTLSEGGIRGAGGLGSGPRLRKGGPDDAQAQTRAPLHPRRLRPPRRAGKQRHRAGLHAHGGPLRRVLPADAATDVREDRKSTRLNS